MSSAVSDAAALDGYVDLPRTTVRGKFIYAGGRKLIVRGVTYGPLGAGEDGGFDPAVAAQDFAHMASVGINAVRVYTTPPRWLLDLASRHGLRAMVGIPWEQHIAFLDTGAGPAIERSIARAVRRCSGHPAILCYAVGNEIPASIVRWHGRRRIERFIARLCDAARQQDPGALMTYVNFPPTEYLRLPDFDLLAFNVYLERRELLERYLARLQNLADDRPLLLAELGLDSLRNGERQQARSLQWQLETGLAAGCAGTFVFSWTDQWHRGGEQVRDWDFGLTTRARKPKLALEAVRTVYSAPPPESSSGPSISVAICTHNGSATLRECLDGVLALRYGRFEVIVVSDGSTDATERIAAEYARVRVIVTPPRGLAAARNTAIEAASGEVVAYIDDDAVPDPDWLRHIAAVFESGRYAAVGGPNVLPAESGRVAQCVANAPGGPTHVLLSDHDAEHIPGCNMAILKTALEEIGGFDSQFRAAGDDVDVCWRLLDSGRRIGFSPGAVVWHRRRSSVFAYLRQQRSYGKAEALLERKHPRRYSAAGHVGWTGQLYGNGAAQHRGGWRWRVYYGGWGTAFYQSIYGPRRGLLESLPLMPECYLAIALLALLAVASVAWGPLLLALPLLGVAVTAVLVDAALGAARARFTPGRGAMQLRLITGLLYLLQPLARLHGRISQGLTPWRRRGPRRPALPLRRTYRFWCEQWRSTEGYARAIMQALRERGAVVCSGGDWDRWDLQVRGGLLGAARVRLGIEEHGGGQQLVRVRAWPHAPVGSLALCAVAIATAALAAVTGGQRVALVLIALTGALLTRMLYELGIASAAIRRALPQAFAPRARPSWRAPRTPPAPARLWRHPQSVGANARDPAR